MQKLMCQRSGVDLIQEIHQKLRGTNTPQRISRFGVCVGTVSLERRPKTQMDYFFMNCKTDSSLITVPKFLDCESGCTFVCTVDKGPGYFLVSVICKGVAFCGRRNVVLRTDHSHAISALSTVLCQARKEEETILKHSPTYSSAKMDAIEVANRFVLKIEISITDVVRHASWLLNGYRVKLDGSPPPQRDQRTAIRRIFGRAG